MTDLDSHWAGDPARAGVGRRPAGAAGRDRADRRTCGCTPGVRRRSPVVEVDPTDRVLSPTSRTPSWRRGPTTARPPPRTAPSCDRRAATARPAGCRCGSTAGWPAGPTRTGCVSCPCTWPWRATSRCTSAARRSRGRNGRARPSPRACPPASRRPTPAPRCSGLEDALRVFEIHPGQCGVLVYAADALAAAFVVPHPDDYRALHPTLIQDLYGELIYHYAPARMPVPRLAARASTTRRSRSLADLRPQARRGRTGVGGLPRLGHGGAGCCGAGSPAATSTQLGRFTLPRFLPAFERQRREPHRRDRSPTATGGSRT